MDESPRPRWIAGALFIATLLLAPGPSTAQTPRAGVPKPPPRDTTVPVSTGPESLRMLADWIGERSAAPATIPGERERGGTIMPVTVILGSEVELGRQTYDTQGQGNVPRNVVIVADTIRISGPVTFDLSGDEPTDDSKARVRLLERSGGDLILLARTVVCEANGKLIFRSSGGAAREQCSRASESKCRTRRATCDVVHGTDGSSSEVCRWNSTGNPSSRAQACSAKGGIWTTSNSRYAQRHLDAVPPGNPGACLTEVSNLATRGPGSPPKKATLGRGGLGGNLVIAAEGFSLGGRFHDPEAFGDLGCIDAQALGGAGSPAGRPGTVRLFGDMKQAVTALQEESRRPYGLPVASHSAQYAVSKWVIRFLEDAITGVQVAGLSTSKVDAARRLRQATDVVGGTYPVLAEDRDEFESHLRDLQALQDRFQTGLWMTPRTISVPGGVPHPVELFTEGRDLQTRLAPTIALVKRRTLGGRDVLGLLEFNPDQPDTVRMAFEVEFIADPWLETLVAQELANEGATYGGVFSNWILEGREITSPGIRTSSIQVSGATAQISLTVDAARASLVMAKLASSAGLPLTFDWQYRDDLNQRGLWRGPTLSLQHQTTPRVDLDGDGRATNQSDMAVTVEYLRLGDAYLPRRQTILPGETVVLVPTDRDPAMASIPAAAVSHGGMDPFRFERNFHIINGEEMVEQITVTNRLGFDPERGGALDHVEINVTYTVGEGESSYEAAAGPYRLNARDTTGAEITVSFLKPQRAPRQILITGTAYYENESSQTLTATTFSDLTIKITEEMLP